MQCFSAIYKLCNDEQSSHRDSMLFRNWQVLTQEGKEVNFAEKIISRRFNVPVENNEPDIS